MKKHLLEAAERGNAEAQFNLGVMCENGLDDNRYVVEGSRLEAERWFLAAAEQGLPRAQIKLAEIYAEESEISGSSVKACGWFLLATATLRGAQLERAQSSIPARRLPTDAGSDRGGQAFCGRLEAKNTDPHCSLGSPAIPRGEMRVIKTWICPADRDPYSDRH